VLPAPVQVVADVELVLGLAAGHHAQRLAEVRSQPGLHRVKVSGSDDQHRLILKLAALGLRGAEVTQASRRHEPG
jgi:hypothetical protein